MTTPFESSHDRSGATLRSRLVRRATATALLGTAAVSLSFGLRDEIALAQARPASQPAAQEQRMPRAGVDPGGVITGIATRLPTDDVSLLRLRFDAGARTIWHVHVGPQILYVQEGVARVQQRGGKIVDLKAGETIYLPPNVAHWHGAAPQSSTVMLSVYPIGSKLDPGAEVTESEYLGKSSK